MSIERTTERRVGERRPSADGRVPLPRPTRRTLVLPAVEGPRSRRQAVPPPLPWSRVSGAADGVPIPRPSERPTLKTLPPALEPVAGESHNHVIELSASALASDPCLDDSCIELDAVAPPGPRRTFYRVALVSVFLGMVAAVVAAGVPAFLTERVTGLSEGLAGPAPVPREAASQHTPLRARVTTGEVSPAAGACAAAGPTSVVARRAQLASGLDVSALAGGFGVAFSARGGEALGVRLQGASPRIVERLRVRSGARVRHATIARGGDDDDGIELMIDGDDARSVVPDGEAPAFRVAVVGGWVQAAAAGSRKTLWALPGRGAPPTKASASMRTREGFVRISGRAPRAAPAIHMPRTDLRAAARSDGGAVIALRRASSLWLGMLDARLAPDGPLVTLLRPSALLGMPSVAPSGQGGAVAWAERSAGHHEWTILVASFGGRAGPGESAGRGGRAPTSRTIGEGMSPSLAALPDGELLLAYAVGAPGSHRVVVRRLGRDLEPRGEPIFVSPAELNAGQPSAAVGADGGALVAFFAAGRGGPPRVLATPLACDLGDR